MQNIPTPSNSELKKYLERWDNMPDYVNQENSLNKLFWNLVPNNTNIEDILLKCSVLNDFYSTNIFKIFPVAEHILKLNIDSRLKKGDATLVKDIESVNINGKVKYFYSFATKYCSHHDNIDYPIYDSYVERILIYFRDKDKFSNFASKELKDYQKFKSALLDFIKFYKLNCGLKDLDRYLRQLGKEYFPNQNYKKSKNNVTSHPKKNSNGGKAKNFTFSSCGIDIGEEVYFTKNGSITAIVTSDKTVEYNGKTMTLTGLAKKILKKDKNTPGPDYFSYKGKTLNDIRRERGLINF